MKRLFTILFGFFLLFQFTSCKNEPPLPKQETAKLFIDLMTVEEMHRHNAEVLKSKRDSLFDLYKVTPDQYHESIKSFESDEEEWEEFFNLAQNYLDTLKVHAGAN